METTFYFIVSFYYSNARELFLVETRKMVCYSRHEHAALRLLCRKHCRRLFLNGFGRKASDVTFRFSIVSESQYNRSTYNLL